MLRYQKRIMATVSALALAAPAAALAQTSSAPAEQSGEVTTVVDESNSGLGDIVVTAQRREERLQDVPIAITAVSGETLSQRGIANSQDIAAVTPGLTFTEVVGTAAPRIRGVGTVSAQIGNENSVATYVDGVYYASAASSILSLRNIEQVAVLKGPQGTLFGRNATGGLIQITTRDPRDQPGGEFTATYGNLDTFGGSAYLTGGLADGLAGNIYVDYLKQSDGFGRNLTTGGEVSRQNNLVVRGKLKWEIGENTTITLAADYGRFRADKPARRPTYETRGPGGVRFTGGPFDIVSTIIPRFENHQGGASLTAVHHFDGVDLISISAYRKSRSPSRFDAGGLPFATVGVDLIARDHQFSQEFQLVSTGSGPFSYTLGAYYFESYGAYDPSTLTTPAVIKRSVLTQRATSPALYAQGTYKFGDTSLTMGTRYSSETRDLDSISTTTVRATNAIINQALQGHLRGSKPTWRVSLDHHFSRDVMIYGSYNRGFKSGGFNAATIDFRESFEPEVLDAFEIGTKADLFDRALRINASAYYYDYSNIQLTSYLGGQVRITNAASAKIKGFDLDLVARPINNLTLTGGFAYTHARFGTFTNAQISRPAPAGQNIISVGAATGNRLPYTPDFTFNAGFDYVIPFGSARAMVSAQYSHSDGWFAESDNRLRQAPYDLLNASLRLDLGDSSKVNLTFWGRNLTNEVYAVRLQTQPTNDVVEIAAGRTFGATLGYKF